MLVVSAGHNKSGVVKSSVGGGQWTGTGWSADLMPTVT